MAEEKNYVGDDFIVEACCASAAEDMTAVKWNPYNKVVQCHACGHVYVPNNYTPDDVKALDDAKTLRNLEQHVTNRLKQLKDQIEMDRYGELHSIKDLLDQNESR